MSPNNKGVIANTNGSIIETQMSIDQSQQSIIIQNNNGKRAGPIKVQP